MYEVPKQSYQLCGPDGVSYASFALLFFVLEVFKCFGKCSNDTSTSLNSEKSQNQPIRTKVAPIHSQTSIFYSGVKGRIRLRLSTWLWCFLSCLQNE
jgi:hypothetical protein